MESSVDSTAYRATFRRIKLYKSWSIQTKSRLESMDITDGELRKSIERDQGARNLSLGLNLNEYYKINTSKLLK